MSSCCMQGWGARTCVLIQRGQFVAQYAGELITSAEAARRLAEIDAAPGPTCHALLVSFIFIALLNPSCIQARYLLLPHLFLL